MIFFKRLLKLPWNVLRYDRQKGLDEELLFWDRWLASKGMDWKADFARRFDSSTELMDVLHPFIDNANIDNIRILDVGSGPVTKIGYTYKGHKLKINACDPLGDKYNELINKYNLVPPVVTDQVEGERLTAHYKNMKFDLVTAFNCLDHSENPFDIILEMCKLVKSNGVIFLCHNQNEAKNQNYGGLHRWNFSLNNKNELLLQNFGTKINLDQELSNYNIEHKLIEERIHTTIDKR